MRFLRLIPLAGALVSSMILVLGTSTFYVVIVESQPAAPSPTLSAPTTSPQPSRGSSMQTLAPTTTPQPSAAPEPSQSLPALSTPTAAPSATLPSTDLLLPTPSPTMTPLLCVDIFGNVIACVDLP